jgi:hypothetical protein
MGRSPGVPQGAAVRAEVSPWLRHVRALAPLPAGRTVERDAVPGV